ncbi:MAG: MBL fold metallo-hydrolase [Armatimonadota bacterium]|nr:MBL fold metallo-hydrolase [Armatimonadota bacterium]MDR7550100.1 MBL fold metallo-hydrolase [Armatimonadota bacterium]
MRDVARTPIIPLPLPTPYPVGPVMAYLLPGPPVTLVDCGPKTPEAQAALEEGLARAGTGLARIERLIITHGHVDHFGLARTVAAASGARVFAHRADAPKLALDRAFVPAVRRLIDEAGFGPDAADALLDVFRRYRSQVDPIAPTDLLADGDRIRLGSQTLEVLHTPGHAQGHICLWDGEALISGDLLLEEISPNPLAEFSPDGRRLRTLPALLRSLRRVADLDPAVAYPGHGEPILRPAERALDLIRHHEERKDRLARMLASRAWTVRELAADWFPELDQPNLFLGLSEVLGHLDLLDEEGRLTVERSGGVVHYSLAT